MQWMVKSKQTLTEETRILAFNERGIKYIPNIWKYTDKDWLKDFDDDKDVEDNTWRYWRQYSLCLKILIVIDLNFF